MPTYDKLFYDYVNSGAIRSAEHVLPYLTRHIVINSVLDIGCGQGAWLSVWRKLGTFDIQGIDGDYVDRSKLMIDDDRFHARNLENGFDLGKRFDLVQSLEVAEHLPETSASCFVESLVKHSDLVLFAAAAKGDGGDHHINEQDYNYWQQHFERHGYMAFDYLRPLLKRNHYIEPWYRYNIFLYVAPQRIPILPQCIRETQVEKGKPLLDISPLPYKLRKLIIRMFPITFVTKLSKVKQRLMTWIRTKWR